MHTPARAYPVRARPHQPLSSHPQPAQAAAPTRASTSPASATARAINRQLVKRPRLVYENYIRYVIFLSVLPLIAYYGIWDFTYANYSPNPLPRARA